jgi:hypothetical protein
MWKRILLGTLVVGSFDICEVILFYGFRDVPATRILQSVARGWLGSKAFSGGIPAALLGLATHYFIAFGVVTVYYIASRRLELLRRWPIVMGMVYGLGVFLVMNYIVLPKSKAGMANFTTVTLINQLFCHLILIGIPAAVITTSRMRADEMRADLSS